MQMTSKQLSATTSGKPQVEPRHVHPHQLPLSLDPLENLLNTTGLARKFAIRPIKMNAILSQIGWIKQAGGRSGWQVTEYGKRFGGVQFTHNKSGRKYVLWPETIAKNAILVNAVLHSAGSVSGHQQDKPSKLAQNRPQSRKPIFPKLRATDGHVVGSRAELIIDNWLHSRGIAHEYERPLPFDGAQRCDFYINVGKGVYIEFCDCSSDPLCLSRKRQKRQSYLMHSLQLIELDQDELSDLDYLFARKLRLFGVYTE